MASKQNGSGQASKNRQESCYNGTKSVSKSRGRRKAWKSEDSISNLRPLKEKAWLLYLRESRGAIVSPGSPVLTAQKSGSHCSSIMHMRFVTGDLSLSSTSIFSIPGRKNLPLLPDMRTHNGLKSKLREHSYFHPYIILRIFFNFLETVLCIIFFY